MLQLNTLDTKLHNDSAPFAIDGWTIWQQLHSGLIADADREVALIAEAKPNPRQWRVMLFQSCIPKFGDILMCVAGF